MSSDNHSLPSAQTADAIAASWVARELRGRLSQAERTERDEWLAASLDHRDAYELAHVAYAAAGEAASDPEMLAMREAALRAMRDEPRKLGRRWMFAGGGLAMAAAMVLAVVLTTPDTGTGARGSLPPLFEQGGARAGMADRYTTRVGERLAVNLDDGSVMTLNTASEVRIHFTPQARQIELVRGQALFSVAHDADWPFYVVGGGQAVRALGTEFDVRLQPRGLEVVLVQGRVAVGDQRRVQRGDLSHAVMLEAGERLISISNVSEVAAIDTSMATAWRRGRVSFSETPLRQAVDEINRYRSAPIVIRDPRVARLMLSGTYRTADAANFEDSLAVALPVEAHTGDDGAIELVWRATPEGDAAP